MLEMFARDLREYIEDVVVDLEGCSDCDRNLALSTHLEHVMAHLVHHGEVYDQ